MKSKHETATEGALLLLLGILLGMLLAAVIHEYGIREARKAANSVLPPSPSYWDGKRFIPGHKA